MKLVRFRVMEPDLGEPEDIHYGYASEDGTIYCGCGCHGTFELEDCEILDTYEPSEAELDGIMGWPYCQSEQVFICPVNDASCPYWREGGVCLIGRPDLECDDYMAMMDEADCWEVDDCDNDCGYDPYLGCFTDDC